MISLRSMTLRKVTLRRTGCGDCDVSQEFVPDRSGFRLPVVLDHGRWDRSARRTLRTPPRMDRQELAVPGRSSYPHALRVGAASRTWGGEFSRKGRDEAGFGRTTTDA